MIAERMMVECVGLGWIGFVDSKNVNNYVLEVFQDELTLIMRIYTKNQSLAVHERKKNITKQKLLEKGQPVFLLQAPMEDRAIATSEDLQAWLTSAFEPSRRRLNIPFLYGNNVCKVGRCSRASIDSLELWYPDLAGAHAGHTHCVSGKCCR